MRLRIVVHALDRTGPPVLAATFAAWVGRERGWDVDVVAFRGGPLEHDPRWPGSVMVLLDDHEPWDHDRPDPARVAALSRRCDAMPVPDATLLVSVAAGQALPLLSGEGPVVTWVVEVGDDLHWIDDLPELRTRTTTWLAGARATAVEVASMLGPPEPLVVPEFVAAGAAVPDDVRAEVRAGLGAGPDDLLVLGAGIGTFRKGIDLFVEVAASVGRRGGRVPVRFAWVGGEHDPLYGPAGQEAAHLGLPLVVVPGRPDFAAVVSSADVLLHVARADAFPLVCLHAALAATPVVAFASPGGLQEMFGPTFLGATYPDVAAVTDCLLELTDPGVRAARAAAQRAHVAARFEVEVAGPALATVLEAA